MPIPAWLSNFIGFGWIRDLLGIRKDIIDTKKSKLEVKKLEHEERTRQSLITPATFEDVKKYDPKYRAITIKVEESEFHSIYSTPSPTPIWRRVLNIIFWLFILLSILLIIISLLFKLFR